MLYCHTWDGIFDYIDTHVYELFPLCHGISESTHLIKCTCFWMRNCAFVCLLVWEQKYRLCMAQSRDDGGSHILPKAAWNLICRSCSRRSVKVNSPRFTAQTSTPTVKFCARSTVLITSQQNELAQVMTAVNCVQKSVLSEFVLRHWLII
jgi:hypothetical protein